MKSYYRWDNLLITILIWLFIWDFYDSVLDEYHVTNKHRMGLSFAGIIIISTIIYYDSDYH